MNKRSQFRTERRDGRILMIDTSENEYQLTAAQAEHLGRRLAGEAKQLRRARGLRRLIKRQAGAGK